MRTTPSADALRASGSSGPARRALWGVFAASMLGGTAFAVIPSASAAPDPCEASEIARTISTVSNDTSEYLDSHPQTNAALTNAGKLQGPQALAYLKSYFDANPTASEDLQELNEPLVNLSGQCRLPISAPQALQMLQAATSGGGLGLPGGIAVPAGLPGAATASEVMTLRDEGYEVLKFFPAEQAGGAAYLKSLASPLAGTLFCPTGGISLKIAPDYLSSPNVVCVGGSWVAPKDMVSRGDWDGITRLAAEAFALGK